MAEICTKLNSNQHYELAEVFIWKRSRNDVLIHTFNFLRKYRFVKVGSDLYALDTSRLTPVRILQNGIEQAAEFLFSLILKSVSSIYQKILDLLKEWKRE